VTQSDQTERANTARDELRLKLTSVDEESKQEKENRRAIFTEMSRQYKTMEEELIRRINLLEDENLELKEQLEMVHLLLEETKREKDRQLLEKDENLAEQKQKMDYMALEFSNMLKVMNPFTVDNFSVLFVVIRCVLLLMSRPTKKRVSTIKSLSHKYSFWETGSIGQDGRAIRGRRSKTF
jgi:hypothetical protein